ncbi:hypothetical protein ACH3XW_1520 [Acanthocheilonema viteae]
MWFWKEKFSSDTRLIGGLLRELCGTVCKLSKAFVSRRRRVESRGNVLRCGITLLMITFGIRISSQRAS